jgi:EmrB/QacA subfamily drug resistance transporter
MNYKWKALSVTTLGALLASMQGSSLLLALPQILIQLKTNFITLIWIILIYLLAITVFIPIVGRLADLLGKKTLYNLGFAIFTLGSLLCGISQSSFHGYDLLFSRLVQGIGAALLFTNSTAIVTDAFSGSKDMGLGFGINQIAVAAGFVIGPILGGLLAPISWRLIFLVNIPLGIIGTVWGIIALKDIIQENKKESFDYIGSIFLTLSLTSLLLALSLISLPNTNIFIVIILFIVFLILGIIFLLCEKKIKFPVFNFSLFKNRIFLNANITGFLNSIARGASLFILIFFLQGPYHRTPFEAGLMIIPFGISFLILAPISGFLSDKYNYKLLTSSGLLISAIGLFGFIFVTGSTSYFEIAILMSLLGIGSGIFSSPNTNAIMRNVDSSKRGEGSGVRGILSNLGQMLSVAIIFPIILGSISEKAMSEIFIYGGKSVKIIPGDLVKFINSIHMAFLILLIFTLIAMVMSITGPSRITLSGNPGINN